MESGHRHDELIRRYFDSVLSNADPSVADEILTDDIVCTLPSGEVLHGPAAVKAAVAGAAAAFPHRGVVIHESVTSGDTTVVRYGLTMAHTGPFQGIPPTGREVSVDAVDIFRFSQSKISEIRVYFNPLAIMSQLGVGVTFEAPTGM